MESRQSRHVVGVDDTLSFREVPTLDELVASARALAPMIAEAAARDRNHSDLPVEIIAAMKAAGLHRPYMPRRFGGYEMEWGAHYAISREISRASGSAGWITSLVFSHIMFVGRFPLAAQEAFFAASPDGVLSTASAGAGTLTAAPGGMRLTGRWGFASGVKHAGGQMVIAKLGDSPIFTHFCLLLPGEYEIEETWDSVGLQATGSHHVRVTDQFVPAERLIERDIFLGNSPPGAEVSDSYLFRIKPAPYQKSWFMGPLIGTAEGALEGCVAQTRIRRGQIFGEAVADQVPVQVNIGAAIAEIDAASLIFDRYTSMLRDLAAAGTDPSAEDILWGKRNVTFGSRLCLAAAERLSGVLGASGQAAANPVQRHYLDCRTVTTHIELNWDHALSASGKYSLGLPTGDPVIDGKITLPDGTTAMLGTQI